jgi:hypothetical protein
MINLSQFMMFLLATMLGLVNCFPMPDGMEMHKPDNDLKDDLNCYREVQVQLLRLYHLLQDDCPHSQSRHHVSADVAKLHLCFQIDLWWLKLNFFMA